MNASNAPSPTQTGADLALLGLPLACSSTAGGLFVLMRLLLFVLMRCCLCSCAVVCAHALLFVLMRCCLCSCTVVCAHALLFCSCSLVCAHALLFVLMLSCLCSCAVVCAHVLLFVLIYIVCWLTSWAVCGASVHLCTCTTVWSAEPSCVQSTVAVGPGAQGDLSHWLW